MFGGVSRLLKDRPNSTSNNKREVYELR
jgi:hypothetical protein